MSGAVRRLVWLAPLCLLLAWVHRAVPLLPEASDSAWYYMNVHFLLTGEYLHEARYPSFREPMRIYALGGYSLVLLAARWLADASGASWAVLVGGFQLACHLASGMLLGLIAARIGLRAGAGAASFLYLLWFPFFHYSTFVMSETYGIFLLLASLALVLTRRPALGPAGLALLGLAALVRLPFLALLPVYLVLALASAPRKLRSGALCLLAFAAAPAVELLVGARVYGELALRPGSGWNLWDRVIVADRLVPRRSARLAELMAILAKHRQRVKTGPWWEVTSQLSRLGYSLRQTQEFCRDIAVDGIREHPWRYLAGTFTQAAALGASPVPVRLVEETYPALHRHLSRFAGAADHAPLGVQLERGFERVIARQVGRDSGPALRLHAAWGRGFERVAGAGVHAALLAAAAAALILAVIRSGRSGRAGRAGRGEPWRTRAAVLSIPWLLLLASSAVNLLVPRYNLVALPFTLLGAIALAEDAVARLRGASQGPGSPAQASPRTR